MSEQAGSVAGETPEETIELPRPLRTAARILSPKDRLDVSPLDGELCCLTSYTAEEGGPNENPA